MLRQRRSEIVQIRLRRNESGAIDRQAPFLLFAHDGSRSGYYVYQPNVIAQLAHDEDNARFEAAWDGKEWTFGRRVQDA
jgi:hypothetical protein